jgi:hypothetical protein
MKVCGRDSHHENSEFERSRVSERRLVINLTANIRVTFPSHRQALILPSGLGKAFLDQTLVCVAS